jgi:predicted TIM-barrel fold metal-dependent hydrolase
MRAMPDRNPPPLEEPHRPNAVVLPPNACDTHCHLFGPQARYPIAAGSHFVPAEAGLERYERMQARMGLSRTVFVQSSAHGSDHRGVLEALRTNPARYRAVALIDERHTRADISALHAAGVRGTRFHFVSHIGGRPDDDGVAQIIDRIAPFGWHVLLHVDGGSLLQNAERFDRLPVPFVIDHLARIDAAAGTGDAAFRALLALARNPRCWIKISGADRMTAAPGPPYDDVVPFARAAIAAAPERVIWGTDWPHTNVRAMPDDGDLVDLLARFAPDDDVRRRILVDNPQRLYGFGAS